VPYIIAKHGPDRDQLRLRWGTPVEGAVVMRVRIDDPF